MTQKPIPTDLIARLRAHADLEESEPEGGFLAADILREAAAALDSLGVVQDKESSHFDAAYDAGFQDAIRRAAMECLEQIGSATDDISDTFHRGHMHGARACAHAIQTLALRAERGK